MKSSPHSGTPRSRSPIITSPTQNSYLPVPESLTTPTRQESLCDIPLHSNPSAFQQEDCSFDPTRNSTPFSHPNQHFDNASLFASPTPIPTQTSAPQQSTSQIHIITCPCHTSLLTQTIQAFSSSRNSSDYTYNHHLTPAQPLTIRDILPFQSLTSSLLSYTLPAQLATIISTIPKTRSELSTLPFNLLTTLLTHLPIPTLPTLFSTAVLPCLAPTPSQLFAALKHRVHLYLLQNNLFVLVVLKKMIEFYTYYCSFWVIFNIVNLPITITLGLLRLAREIVGEVVWGVVGTLLVVDSESLSREEKPASRMVDGEVGGWDRRGEDMVKGWQVEIEDVEEFLVVDVD